jgi:VCBS repeat-containing protein
MTDAVARINANTPFETDDDTAYVGDLAPGESTTVTFTVSVDGAATPKTYSVDTTVKYDNSFGRTVVTDVEPTAVEVTEKRGGLIDSILQFLGL